MVYWWVFLGGGLGSLCRYGVAQIVPNLLGHFPWGTFIANLLSCFILGFLIGWNEKYLLSNSAKLFFMTGFCGGFSTFSTFISEQLILGMDNQFSVAFLYVFSSIVIGLITIFFGLKLGQLL